MLFTSGMYLSMGALSLPHSGSSIDFFQLYDYALTLSLEVSLFWLAPWKMLNVLFLLTRYLPFATSGTLIHCEISF